MYLVSSYVPQ